ncbi:helix-turn-helix domain-containing protein [Vampirovibrio chlorellavorus]|uniref:helix-turn-helix domain-containing protein n=1 Tax=Vampirovibrio chlorellavorus TaxID=758823 RepID=UPI0026F27CBE|nr:helix-turn-helix transcriptional regulator [Vampirovibrio chlorellavorus]
MSRLGDRLKELRGNLSLMDVEKGSGIPRFTISRYESGENVPSPSKIKQLAAFFEIPYPELRKTFYEELFLTNPDEKEAMLACVFENLNKEELLARLHQMGQ